MSRGRGEAPPPRPPGSACPPAHTRPLAETSALTSSQGTPTRSLVFGRAASTPAPASSKRDGDDFLGKGILSKPARNCEDFLRSERYVSRPVILLIRTLERVSTPPIHPHVPRGHSPRPPLGVMLHNRKAKCRCSAQRADVPPRAQAQRWSRCSASCWPWRPSWRWPLRSPSIPRHRRCRPSGAARKDPPRLAAGPAPPAPRRCQPIPAQLPGKRKAGQRLTNSAPTSAWPESMAATSS